MSAEANIALVQGIYDAFAAGDAERALQLFAQDLVLHEPPSLPYGGTYRGIAELVGVLIPRIAPYVDLGALHLDRLVGDDEVVIACVRAAWKGGPEVEFRECFHISDGQVTEMRIFVWDSAALTEPTTPTAGTT
jgi:ketosteroid isomerase-like protein